jgi:uncharacterized protein (TIGR02271 family)
VGRTIFALFDDVLTAQRVASALEQEGYDRRAMSLVAPDPRGEVMQSAPNTDIAFVPATLAGIGPAAVAGPLRTPLGRSNVDLTGVLTEFGFDGPDARHYFECLRRGEVLFAVEAPANDDGRHSQAIMRRLGARSVHAEEAAPNGDRRTTREEVTVPVLEEHLEIGKRQVNRGGLRVHSEVVEEPVQESVRLREERVNVERRPVYRDATEADLVEFKEGSIEIRETVEEPVISKRRRVVEEIVVGRETRERTASISETLRKTHVNVEPLQPGAGTDTDIRTLHDSSARRGEPFEDYEPAYRYGGDLAADDRFRNAEWSEVEGHARAGWEEQNLGAWDQFKDAIHGAWEKVTRR